MFRHIRQRLLVVLLLAGLASIWSCAGQSVYVPAGKVAQSSTYTQTDMKMMATAMYESIQQKLAQIAPADAPRPIVALYHIENRTSEHIDTDVVADKLQIELIKAGSLRFVDRRTLKSFAREYDLGGSGMINPDQAKSAGNALGADYILDGEMTSIMKTEGRKQTSYYRISMKMKDTETQEVIWTDDFDITKEKTRTLLGI